MVKGYTEKSIRVEKPFQARGRNGDFKPHDIDVFKPTRTNLQTQDEQSVTIAVYSNRSSFGNPPLMLELSLQDAKTLADAILDVIRT